MPKKLIQTSSMTGDGHLTPKCPAAEKDTDTPSPTRNHTQKKQKGVPCPSSLSAIIAAGRGTETVSGRKLVKAKRPDPVPKKNMVPPVTW